MLLTPHTNRSKWQLFITTCCLGVYTYTYKKTRIICQLGFLRNAVATLLLGAARCWQTRRGALRKLSRTGGRPHCVRQCRGDEAGGKRALALAKASDSGISR